MARPTLNLQLSDTQALALRNVVDSNPEGSIPHTRASIMIALSEGKQARQVADEFSVHPSTVTAYAKKYREGGVENLLSNAPRVGRCGHDRTPVLEQVKAALSTPVPEGLSEWDALSLAKELNVPRSSVQKALRELNMGSKVSLKLPQELQQKNNEIRGLYISPSVQILAVATSSPASCSTPLPAEDIMVYDSSDVEYRESVETRDGDRLLALALQSLISFPNRAPGKQQTPSDFVQTILNTPHVDGGELYFLVNAQNVNELISTLPEEGSYLTSCLTFKELKSSWYKVLDNGNHIVNKLLKKISQFLCKALSDQNSNPFILKIARIKNSDTIKMYFNNEYQKSKYSVTDKHEDNGITITCTAHSYDKLIDKKAFIESKNINEYISNVGNLEESIRKSHSLVEQSVMNNLLCSDLNLSEIENKKNDNQRLVEIETMVGRVDGVLSSGIDKTNLPKNIRFWSPELKEIVIEVSGKMSFENASNTLNRFLMRNGYNNISGRTLDDCCQRWGEEIHQDYLCRTREILIESKFDPDTVKPLPGAILPKDPVIENGFEDNMKKLLDSVFGDCFQKYPKYSDLLGALESIELPNNVIYLMIDDVSVKRQKEHRDVNGKIGSKSAKTVGNSIVVILCNGLRYVIRGDNTREALTMALAYMLKNKLLENRILVTFSDGAREIRDAIPEIFGFHQSLKQYLDWYHICRRINENLSMGLKCGREHKEAKKQIIREILKNLWFGNVDKAIDNLKSIDAKMIRVQTKITDTIEYLDARRPYLYCFAARKITGLINSSARVEGMNNRVVSSRQKHKGMSWSENGSRGLAYLAVLKQNGELSEWIRSGNVQSYSKHQPEVADAA